MSGELIVAVLSEARHKFGTITPANQQAVSQWVRQRVGAIKAGQAQPSQAHPTLPRSFEASWYQPIGREPGDDEDV